MYKNKMKAFRSVHPMVYNCRVRRFHLFYIACKGRFKEIEKLCLLSYALALPLNVTIPRIHLAIPVLGILESW